MTPPIRLAKAISNNGYCSRRKAEELIAQGQVLVNGELVRNIVTFVSQDDNIELLNRQKIEPAQGRLWLYYKPVGLITTYYDPQGRPTVFAHLPFMVDQHIVSIGRLDVNSEGLLLLTTSKQLAKKLEDPKNKFERIYKVRVFGPLSKSFFTIEKGIQLDGIRYKPIKLKHISAGINSWYEMILQEGKNREIRRICQAFGLSVNRLIRTQYGPFELGNLKPGEALEVEFEKFSYLI